MPVNFGREYKTFVIHYGYRVFFQFFISIFSFFFFGSLYFIVEGRSVSGMNFDRKLRKFRFKVA